MQSKSLFFSPTLSFSLRYHLLISYLSSNMEDTHNFIPVFQTHQTSACSEGPVLAVSPACYQLYPQVCTANFSSSAL